MDSDPRQFEHVIIRESDVHNIVLSYLVHNCFKDTLESFIASTGIQCPINYIEEMEKRKRIFHFALDGKAMKAIEMTEELLYDVLEKNKDLHFDLLGLHFLELVRTSKCAEALEFAQAKLAPFGKAQKYVGKLEDLMALLAYEEPEKSPMFHLLSSDHRQLVADNLNQEILAHHRLPHYSTMERLVRQEAVVRQLLDQDTGKSVEQGNDRTIEMWNRRAGDPESL